MSKQMLHDAAMERAASVAAYGTSGSVAVTGWTMQEWFGLVGATCVVLTFLVNAYYKHLTHKHQLAMQCIAAGKVSREADKGAGPSGN
jgi:hypothetical protein